MPTNENFSGVSNCYVFKSRLQEYAQKVGLPTPVYETIKEGPSHEPSFRSKVIVNDVRYDSLPGFFNRKAAEQSAAEVALVELLKSGEVNESLSQPVHETGLCKNLLQEYAQKMNYAIPVYMCQKDETPGRASQFSCTVEIGGIRYIGAAASTKKEAEIKAARTALLAIQSSTSELYNKAVGNAQLTVIPCRKRAMETASKPKETVNAPKAKKPRFKKKMLKKRLMVNNGDHYQDKTTGNSGASMDDPVKPEWVQTGSFTILSSEGSATEVMRNPEDVKLDDEINLKAELPGSNVDPSQGKTTFNSAIGMDASVQPEWVQNDSFTVLSSETSAAEVMRSSQVIKLENNMVEKEIHSTESVLAPQTADNSKNAHLRAVSSVHNNHKCPDVGHASMDYAAVTTLVRVAEMGNGSTVSQMEAPEVMPGLNIVERISVDSTHCQVETAYMVNASTTSQIAASEVMPGVNQEERINQAVEKIQANAG